MIRNLKDNYQKILEKKLKNARDALSKLPNPIIELCKSDESYYVSWCNAKAEEAIGGSLFDLNIMDAIKDEKFAATISLCAISGGAHSCVVSLNDRVYEIMCCRLDEHSMQLLFNDLTEVKKSEEYLRALIDFLPEMIVVSDGVDMILCNQSLLKFFRVKSFEEFKDSYKCICNTFIDEPGYLTCDETGFWLQETLKNMKIGVESLAKIFDPISSKELIFSIKATIFMQNKNEFLITFFDVTESMREKMELENKNKELKELASVDSLTGIYNRNKLKEIALNEFRKYKKDKKELSIIIFDIDHFKKINDTFGHNSGDFVLKTIAKIVSNSIRASDAFARWGGEEFVVLAPNTNSGVAFLLAETIRKNIEGLIFEEVGSVTCSFGVAEMVDGFDFEALIENADRALYMAKRSGRNRTETYLA